jgi:SAM-dependent methyltransferase
MLRNSSVRNIFRIGAYLPTDAFEFLRGQRKDTIPPRGMRFDGAESYVSMGDFSVNVLKQFCGLTPTSAVLDVGCGAGRIARPLTTYLTSGFYEGFDIVPSWISWCQRNIQRKRPDVRFTWVDVYSKHYNSTGKITADALSFPYKANAFDCAMLMSVFTHMLPGGIRNYIHELTRVLKPGGKAFITVLLLNAESLRGIKNGTSIFDLQYPLENTLVVDPQFPETAIAIPEDLILSWCKEAGLETKLLYGSWCGRTGSEKDHVHDALVLTKTRLH